MNIERLTKLAEWLEAGAPHQKLKFDMTESITFVPCAFDPAEPASCGTACCIAGAAEVFFGDACELVAEAFGKLHPKYLGDKDDTADVQFFGAGGLRERARDLLQIGDDEATKLFTPNAMGYHSLRYYSDPKWAGRVIRKLIATGEVDWAGTEDDSYGYAQEDGA